MGGTCNNHWVLSEEVCDGVGGRFFGSSAGGGMLGGGDIVSAVDSENVSCKSDVSVY